MLLNHLVSQLLNYLRKREKKLQIFYTFYAHMTTFVTVGVGMRILFKKIYSTVSKLNLLFFVFI